MPTRTTETIDLPVTSPGTQRQLKVIRYGSPGSRPKAYIQTSLHADEIPGMLVIHYLDRLLREADGSDGITGEIVLLPVANPIGLSLFLRGSLSGRFELGNGVNFNRNYPDVADIVAERIKDKLSQDAAANVSLIREQILAVIEEIAAPDETTFMRKTLMLLAADADICLDLHCDWEAVMHIYLGTPLWPDGSDLAAQLGSQATMLAEVSGGNPFDEAVGGVWWALAHRFPDFPVPAACLSSTVELRGQNDITHHSAKQDADNLFHFLMRRGLLEGDAGPLPDLMAQATPLQGVDPVRAPHAGVVVYLKQPGDRVEAGEAVAEIIDPWVDSLHNHTVVHSRVAGVMFSRRNDRFARPGQTLCRVAGPDPLPDRNGVNLLSD
jgi:predicted deacylase